jgi:DNA-binding NarL/FixJ family response regulator
MRDLEARCRSALTARTPMPRPSPVVSLPDGLSGREVEVLRLVATGRSNRDIGNALFISQNTVANHVRSILQKTASANRAEATAYAARNGLLP